MKVKELVQKLSKFNPEARIEFYNNDIGGHWKILCFDYDDFYPEVDENGEVVLDEEGFSKLQKYDVTNTPWITLAFTKDSDFQPTVAKIRC